MDLNIEKIVDYETGCTFEIEVDTACRHYSGNCSTSSVKLVEMFEGQVFRHKSDQFGMLLMLSGSIELREPGQCDLTVGERRLFLLSPSDATDLICLEPSLFVICRLTEKVQHCEKIGMSELRDCERSEDRREHTLPFKHPIVKYAETLVMAVRSGLLCEIYLNSKFTELMFLLRACYSRTELSNLLYPLLQERSDFQIKILGMNSEVKTAKEMASRFCMTEVGFRKKFKREMGIPPKEYLLQRRKALIHEDLMDGRKSNNDLCDEYGFSSASGFVNFCRTHLGGTPTDLRRTPGPAPERQTMVEAG